VSDHDGGEVDAVWRLLLLLIVVLDADGKVVVVGRKKNVRGLLSGNEITAVSARRRVHKQGRSNWLAALFASSAA
jgi:hypothetical protein